MLSPTPLYAILLCLPLAAIFIFTRPTTTISAVSSGSDAANPYPLILESISFTNTTGSSNPEPLSSPPPRERLTKKPIINNKQTAAANRPPEENENDDVSLLQLASRADPKPKPVKKLAFMFLTTTSPLPFAPLWERFFSRAPRNLYNIYLHADLRGDANITAPFLGVFAGRVVPSKPTRRQTPTLIAAARRLLAHALLHDGSNAMFALLSPSCIPVHSFGYAYRVLIKSRRSFVEILKNEPDAYLRWAARGEQAMIPEVEFANFRIGSQFWVVKRKHARVIVRDTRLWSKFRLPCVDESTCFPEEHYFPTLLSMVDPRGCIPCTLTHVDWSGGQDGHPRMYRADEVSRDLIWAIRKSRPRYGDEESDGSNSSVSVKRRHDPFLFARKFDPESLHRLISIANDVILKD